MVPLAAYTGTSPLEASSSGLTRHRVNRGGNRRLNSVIYRIALTQAHFHPDASQGAPDLPEHGGGIEGAARRGDGGSARPARTAVTGASMSLARALAIFIAWLKTSPARFAPR
jgi:hypothetical protein